MHSNLREQCEKSANEKTRVREEKYARVTSHEIILILMDPQGCANLRLQNPSLLPLCTHCTLRSLGEPFLLRVAAKDTIIGCNVETFKTLAL